MIVMKSTQKTMKSVGLLFTSSEKLAYKIYRWISFAILCVLFEPSCLYLVQNYKNLIKATEVCIYIAAEGVMMAKAIFMYFNQELIRGVLEDLQAMANERIRSGRKNFLLKLDREAELICKCFLGMLAIAICVWSGGPVIAIIYRTFQNTYVPHMYGHPYKAIWPFDYETTPGYEIIYVVNIVYNIYLATYFAACDLFFVSCGLHLVGATQEVENFLLTLDKEIEELTTKNKMRFGAVTRANPSIVTKQLPLYLQLKFREAIRDHHEIIRIGDNLATIEQGIIFSQFLGVLFSLSAIAFQVVIVGSNGVEATDQTITKVLKNTTIKKLLFFITDGQSKGEQQLFFIGPTVVILCQLFMYCYYGQRITDQAHRLAQSIYQLKWYNYPIKFQRYFQLIMLRSQNSNYFSGLGFVSCSLQSFTDVLKFVGSVVALFRNIQS